MLEACLDRATEGPTWLSNYAVADLVLTKVRFTHSDFKINDDNLNTGEFRAAVDFTLPAVDPFRTDNEYFVGLFADSANELPEANETNNAIPGQRLLSEHALPIPVDGRTVSPIGPALGRAFSAAIGDEWIGRSPEPRDHRVAGRIREVDEEAAARRVIGREHQAQQTLFAA